MKRIICLTKRFFLLGLLILLSSSFQEEAMINAQEYNDADIFAVAWSPDGTKIATGHWGGYVTIQNTGNGQTLHTLQDDLDLVIYDLAWSSDSSKLAGAGYDQIVAIWDTANGEVLRLLDHGYTVRMLHWVTNSNFLISNGSEGVFNIWNAENGEVIFNDNRYGDFTQIAEAPNGNQLALQNLFGAIAIWSTNPIQRQYAFGTNHEAPDLTWSIAWNPDSSLIATGTQHGKVRLWDVASQQMIVELQANESNIIEWRSSTVQGVHFSNDGSKLVAVSANGTVRMWDTDTGQVLETTQLSVSSIYDVEWSPDGTKIAYGGEGGNLAIIPSPDAVAATCNASQTVVAGDITGLINAINTANANPDASVIGIEGTYTFTVVNNGLNALPKITTDIKICAQNGATLTRQTGSPTFRFFEVASNGTLTLENLTLTGAEANADPGGAILNTGSLTVNNVTFTGNHAGTGAAIDNHRFGGTSNPITATIVNSTFENNTANYGAALDNDANATMTVTNSTFTGNVAVHDGGAIRNHGTLSLTDSQILNNTASAGGSGIFSTGSTTAHNSCISGNTTSVTSVVHVGSNVQDFAGNYWGAPDGPSGAGGGSGDSVSNNINIADFLTACPHQ